MMVFFKRSDYLDHMVLRPLSHILPNWELSWDFDKNKFKHEEDSYAEMLNDLIAELDKTSPPSKYHDNEDFLAEYVKENLNWNIEKVGNRWICGDYTSLLEQGGYGDIDEKNLVKSAAGRIQAAQKFGQDHFDDMEEGHRKILAYVLAIILYHRTD